MNGQLSESQLMSQLQSGSVPAAQREHVLTALQYLSSTQPGGLHPPRTQLSPSPTPKVNLTASHPSLSSNLPLSLADRNPLMSNLVPLSAHSSSRLTPPIASSQINTFSRLHELSKTLVSMPASERENVIRYLAALQSSNRAASNAPQANQVLQHLHANGRNMHNQSQRALADRWNAGFMPNKIISDNLRALLAMNSQRNFLPNIPKISEMSSFRRKANPTMADKPSFLAFNGERNPRSALYNRNPSPAMLSGNSSSSSVVPANISSLLPLDIEDTFKSSLLSKLSDESVHSNNSTRNFLSKDDTSDSGISTPAAGLDLKSAPLTLASPVMRVLAGLPKLSGTSSSDDEVSRINALVSRELMPSRIEIGAASDSGNSNT